MPKRRKQNARRDRSGKIIPDRGPDRGTPEICAKRLVMLGSGDVEALPLSHASPVDVLCARGWLTSAHVTAARAYQEAHRLVFGSCSPRAVEIARTYGRTPSVRRRLVLRARLDTWTRAVRAGGYWAESVFIAYVLLDQIDGAIVTIARLGEAHIEGHQRMRLVALREALDAIRRAKPVRVSEDAVERAESQEIAA